MLKTKGIIPNDLMLISIPACDLYVLNDSAIMPIVKNNIPPSGKKSSSETKSVRVRRRYRGRVTSTVRMSTI